MARSDLESVTSEVNRVKVEFDAQKLGEILGVPATGFDIYVQDCWSSHESLVNNQD